MGRRKKGRCVKKNKQLNVQEDESLVTAPHSFVISRGIVDNHTHELSRDFRKILEPYTATSLKETRRNSIKDFVSISGLLHVSHMCIFTRSSHSMYLKICRLPRGPTLTFKILNFTLARDVISIKKKQFIFDQIFKHPPLIVLNNFSGEEKQMKLLSSMFQNLFPKINLPTVNLSNIRRCLCFNYDNSTGTIDLRHYAIQVLPVGLSENIKEVVLSRVPDLSTCKDFSEFVQIIPETGSESYAHVTLSQKLSSRGNHEKMLSSIKLHEIGPRLTLKLLKIEEGLLDGCILYHNLITKTEEEKLIIEQKNASKRNLKRKRKNTEDGIKDKVNKKVSNGIKKRIRNST